MYLEKDLLELCDKFQEKLENEAINVPSGTCYLSGYCLSEYLKGKGIDAKSITGSLALVDKNGKYVVYGTLKLKKSKRIGVYHTWCEAIISGKTYIIDASLKYNLIKLKNEFNVKISDKISNSLVTKDKVTYHWKYVQNDSLEKHSLEFLKKIDKQMIENLISL